MTNWLITGGSGQLGTAISKELEMNGVSFTSCGAEDLDITQKEKVIRAVVDLRPKVIVNCAAWTDVDAAENNEEAAAAINSFGPQYLATAAKLCDSKFIQVSTDYVFSGKGRLPWTSQSPCEPMTAYGRTKAEGEKRVLNVYPENSFIVRTAWLYSPWRRNFVKTMINLALNEVCEVNVVNDQIGQPTSAINLAAQMIKLNEFELPPGIYHGTNSGSTTWFEFAKIIFEKVQADPARVIPVESGNYPRVAARPKYSVMDHEGWIGSKVQGMQNWRLALDESFPRILEAFLMEGNGDA